MDIRLYFQKIREAERAIEKPFVVVTSLETPEGGKGGRFTEVSRFSAAQLLVEGKVRLADAGESSAFHAQATEALAAAEEARMASKIQVTLVTDQSGRPSKPRSEKG